MFFSSTLGLGTGPLELGKLATKVEFWEISHFIKPFRLEVCLRYLNNYNNKWMPVLSIGKIKYMITLHKKISYNFFSSKFWIGKFFRQFWEILRKFGLAPNWVQKNTVIISILKFSAHIVINSNIFICKQCMYMCLYIRQQFIKVYKIHRINLWQKLPVLSLGPRVKQYHTWLQSM